MSKSRAWLTPDSLPASYRCQELLLPDDPDWLAIFAGALLLLADPVNWELSGSVTEEQAAGVFEETFYAFDAEECPMFAGQIVLSARTTPPSDKWLLCDGANLAEADYPELFTAIGVTFGSSGAGFFNLPDLCGRMPIGAGAGAGLTVRALADQGGEESHVLTVGELATHRHQILVVAGSVVTAALATTAMAMGTQVGAIVSEYTGSSEAHNNMNPFTALNFMIYTG